MDTSQKELYSTLIEQVIEACIKEDYSVDALLFYNILSFNSSWAKLEFLILYLYKLEAERKRENQLGYSKKIRLMRHFFIKSISKNKDRDFNLALELINCKTDEEIPILLRYKNFISPSFAVLLEMMLDELNSSPDKFKRFFPHYAKFIETSNLSQSDIDSKWNELLEGVKIFLNETGLGISIIAQIVSFCDNESMYIEQYLILDHLVRISVIEDGNREKLYPIVKKFDYIINEHFSKAIKNWYELFLDIAILSYNDTFSFRKTFAIGLIEVCSAIGEIDDDNKNINLNIMLSGYEIVADLYTQFSNTIAREASDFLNQILLKLKQFIISLKSEDKQQLVTNLIDKLTVKSFEKISMFYEERNEGARTSEFHQIMGAGTLFPSYAWTQNVLRPISWSLLPQYMDTENLDTGEEIIAACIENVGTHLSLYPREKFPEMWAHIKANYAFACYSRNERDIFSIDSIEAADAFKEALEVYKPLTHPVECLIIGINLGDIGLEQNNVNNLLEGYKTVVDSIEQGRSISSFEFKQNIFERCIQAYPKVIQGYIIDNNYEKAIEYVERSKTRSLVETLFSSNHYPKNADEKTCNQLDEFRSAINLIQKRIEYKRYSAGIINCHTEDDYFELEQKKQELNQFIEKNIYRLDPSFDICPKFQSICYEDIIKIIPDNKTAIIEWYLTDQKIIAFVLTKKFKIYIWESAIYSNGLNSFYMNPETFQKNKDFSDLISNYIEEYNNNFLSWKSKLDDYMKSLSKLLGINEILSRPEISGCDKLILIPHRSLHLFPLHALPVNGEHLLMDYFERGVSYAPSCQVLQFTYKKEKIAEMDYLFAIQNPNDDLICSDLEVESIKSYFLSSSELKTQDVKKENLVKNSFLSSANYGHFSCHARFSFKSPLDSSIILAGNESLILKDILEINLSNLRLITLSACESGMVDPNNNSDEYIGISNAFLYSGCPNLITSLWAVNDFSSMLLMTKLYKNLAAQKFISKGDITLALYKSQQWLRNLPVEKLDEEMQELLPTLDNYLKSIRTGKRLLFQESVQKAKQRKPYPFKDSYYWAGFISIGF